MRGGSERGGDFVYNWAMPLDIGIGLIAAFLAAPYFDISFAWLCVLSVIFALLPDLDAIVQLVRSRSVGKLQYDHRDLFHRPIPYILLGGLLVLLLCGWKWALLFSILSLGHFIHDSIGIGWGISWLYPFNYRYYKFFTSSFKKSNEENREEVIAGWTPTEQNKIAEQHGDPDWLLNMYFRFKQPYRLNFIIEMLVFVVGVALVFLKD